jgi:ribosomal protein L9
MVVKELVALLGVKTDKQSFNQAESGLGKIAKAAKVMAAAFAAFQVGKKIAGVVQEVADLGDKFDKMAKRSGFASKTLQQLGHAAELSGASINTVETAIKKLQSSQIEAADGTATYADEFKRLGIEVKGVDGELKDTPELLLEIADAMNELDTDAERTQVAMKLLGRSGTQLIPMFKEGSEGIKEMMQELVDLGAVMDDDLVKSSADLIDNQRRLDMALLGVKNTIAKELMPQANEFIEGMIDWWKINGKIVIFKTR